MANVLRAPDGAEFTDLQAYRKHIFLTHFCFKDRTGETLQKVPGEINGQEFHLNKLADCTVMVLDWMDRVVAADLTNCHVFLGPCAESVAIRKCTGCTFVVAAKEVRLTGCSDCVVRFFSPSPLMLDDCHTITVGRFSGAYSGLTHHFEQVGLQPSAAAVKVTDFSSRDASLPTPHFRQLPASEEGEDWEVQLDGAAGDPENPIRSTGVANPPPPPANPPPVLNPLEVQDEHLAVSAASEEDDAGFEFAQQSAADDEFGDQEFAPDATEDGFGAEDSFHNAADPDNSAEDFGTDFASSAVEAQDPFAGGLQDGGDGSAHPSGPPVEDDDPFAEADDGQAAWESSAPSPVGGSDPDAFTKPEFAQCGPPGAPGPDARVEAQERFQAMVAAREEAHAKVQAQTREKAEEELEEFYEKRTERHAVRSTANREAERAMLEAEQAGSAAQANGGPWSRVASMIDMGAKEDARSAALGRMRGLLLQLKGSAKQG